MVKKLFIICSLLSFFTTTVQAADKIVLSDISFMVGHWKGEGDLAPEEQWYPPKANIMPGFFRWPLDNGKQVFEILNFIQEDDGVVFRFKHFWSDLVTWEKYEANTYKISTVKDNCLFMDLISKNKKVPSGIRYCLLDENTIEFVGRNENEAWDDAGFVIKMFKVKGS